MAKAVKLTVVVAVAVPAIDSDDGSSGGCGRGYIQQATTFGSALPMVGE